MTPPWCGLVGGRGRGGSSEGLDAPGRGRGGAPLRSLMTPTWCGQVGGRAGGGSIESFDDPTMVRAGQGGVKGGIEVSVI